MRYCMNAAIVAGALAQSPVAVNYGIHHLAGSQLVANSTGLRLVPGAISKDVDNPLVVPEHPWEAAIQFYTTSLFVPANYSYSGLPVWMLYYACSDAVLFYNPISVCVAISADGRRWTKPLLSYHPYTANGTQPPVNTNIVFITAANTFLGQVMLDLRPANVASSPAPFVMAYEGLVDGVRYPFLAHSPDGLAWTPSAVDKGLPAGAVPPINIGGWSDTMMSLVFDPSLDRYIWYGRMDLDLPNSTAGCQGGYASERWVLQATYNCADRASYCNISDPAGWSAASIAVGPGYPDPLDCTDSYNPNALSFADAAPLLSQPPGTQAPKGGALHLLLPSSFWHLPCNESGAPDTRAGCNDGVMDIRLALGRDPSSSLQPPHGPFVPPHPYGGGWSFPSRDAWISRGVGSVDPASGLFNASGSEADAGFVYATAGGYVDPDAPKLPSNAALDASTSTLLNPSTYVYQLYWGSQTTHAGGGAYLYRYTDALTGVYRVKLRREGYVALATQMEDQQGYGTFSTIPFVLPTSAGPASTLVLRLNAEIGTAGNLTVAVLSPPGGTPVPGYSHDDCRTLHGNGVRQMVTWPGAGFVGGHARGGSRDTGSWPWGPGGPPVQYANLTDIAEAGKPVVLQFRMAHVKLYAWELRSM